MENNLKVAERITHINEYYFSRKLKEIASLDTVIPVISLGIGSPDLLPHPIVVEAFREASLEQHYGYQPYQGIPALRQAMSYMYEVNYDVKLEATNFLPLNGSKEGILHIAMAFVNPGDTVLLPNPCYPTYTSVLKMMGANIIYYTLNAENSWEPDFDELNKLATASPKLLFVNYPHMPTGSLGSLELFEKLVSWSLKHGVILINDNPYSFILNDEPRSIFSVPDALQCCIELNSLSKAYNIAGWRMGMAVAAPEFLSALLKVKSNIDSGTAYPIQKAAMKALK